MNNPILPALIGAVFGGIVAGLVPIYAWQ